MRPARLAPLLLLLGAIAACASNPSPGPSSGAVVIVDNRSSLDADIYLHAGGQATRLGFAPAGERTRLTLGTAQLSGAGLVRLEARPARGGQRTYSDLLSIRPGDELTWVVPAQ
jgi:hypothetical protein